MTSAYDFDHGSTYKVRYGFSSSYLTHEVLFPPGKVWSDLDMEQKQRILRKIREERLPTHNRAQGKVSYPKGHPMHLIKPPDTPEYKDTERKVIYAVILSVLALMVTALFFIFFASYISYLFPVVLIVLVSFAIAKAVPFLLDQYFHFQSARETRKRYRRLVERAKNQSEAFDYDEETRSFIKEQS